jgi:hypothetical protein
MKMWATIALAALLAAAMVGSASAGDKVGNGYNGNGNGYNGNGKGYGKLIKQECGISFGQLRKLAPREHVTPSKGAKHFVESGALYKHCKDGHYHGKNG